MPKSDKLYELQLQQDVAIINSRTAAELGPLPLGGVPVAPKRRPDVKYDKLRANQTIDSEDDDMSMKNTISAAAVAIGLAACQPTVGKPPSQPADSAAPQAASENNISARDVSPDSDLNDAVKVAYETNQGALADSAEHTHFEGEDAQIEPEYRKQFHICMEQAKSEEEKLICIKTEAEYQNIQVKNNYDALVQISDDKYRNVLENEQRALSKDIFLNCGNPDENHLSIDDRLDAGYCKLYKIALRAYELETLVILNKD